MKEEGGGGGKAQTVTRLTLKTGNYLKSPKTVQFNDFKAEIIMKF